MGLVRDIVDDHRDEVLEVVRRNRGRSVALFGSAARGDDRASSDADFLVEFESDSSLLDLARMERELGDLLGCRVDVVSVGGLKPRDDHILADSVPL